jgi:hypothetical protein
VRASVEIVSTVLGELMKRMTSLPTAAGVDLYVCLRNPFGRFFSGFAGCRRRFSILPIGDDVSAVNGLQLFKVDE